MSSDLLIGVDLGTTSLKAALFELEGGLLDIAEVSYPIERPDPESAEQDPVRWLRALEHCLALLERSVGERRVTAVGVCSQVNTHVCLDEQGAPVRPAIVWQDQRAHSVAAELSTALAVRSESKSGRFSLAASSLVSRAEWLRRHEPEHWAQTCYIVSPKDFVTRYLCDLEGPVTDLVTPFDQVDDRGAYDGEVIALVDGLAERLPPIQRFDAPIGVVQVPGLPLIKGATVVTGSMDAWGNLYGSGVVRHGQAMEVAGTSEILGLLSRGRRQTPGVVSFLSIDGLHLHAGPTQAGGAALAWIAQMLGQPIADLVALAEEAERPGRIIFLPHLLGERAPLWDAEARGAFVGLSSNDGAAEIALAVLEGVAFSARHLLEELEKAGDVDASLLRASGGGSQSDLWSQIKADVLNRSIERLRVRHSGCLGAALMSAAGAGLVPSLEQAAEQAVKVERVFEPRMSGGYDATYALYHDIYEALAPTHHRLAGLRAGAATKELIGQ